MGLRRFIKELFNPRLRRERIQAESVRAWQERMRQHAEMIRQEQQNIAQYSAYVTEIQRQQERIALSNTAHAFHGYAGVLFPSSYMRAFTLSEDEAPYKPAKIKRNLPDWF